MKEDTPWQFAVVVFFGTLISILTILILGHPLDIISMRDAILYSIILLIVGPTVSMVLASISYAQLWRRERSK